MKRQNYIGWLVSHTLCLHEVIVMIEEGKTEQARDELQNIINHINALAICMSSFEAEDKRSVWYFFKDICS